MRNLINIINEASVANYPEGTLYLISGSEPGRKLAKELAAQGINVEDVMTSVNWGKDAQDPGKYAATYNKNAPGKLYTAFRDADGQLWVFYGSTDGYFVHADKLPNRGEIAEGILGAAMFAKFTKRAPQEEIAQVTVEDIDRVLKSLKQVSTTETTTKYQVQVKDSDNQHADTVSFDLELKTAPKQALFDLGKRNALKNEFSSAAAYVNTPNAERYSRYFYVNGKADAIEVIASGATEETKSKVDVFVQVNGKKLRLNTSLKVGGVKQFGQVGGGEQASMIKLWKYFGVDVAQYANKFEKMRSKDQFSALEWLYRTIADQLSAELAGDNDTEEAKFVTNIANAVSYFATLGEKNVELVDFSKGGFKILRFNDLVQKLRGVNLTATYKEAKGRPEIGIHDVADPKRELVSIRVKIENKKAGIYVRNIIEKGPLLEELTTVKKGSLGPSTGSKAIPRTLAPAPKTAKPAPQVAPTQVPQDIPATDASAEPANDDTTDYRYSAESIRPKRGISEIRQRR